MLLTIGTPTHNDQKGLAFTFTLLREQIVRLGLQDRVQLLAVDNNPHGKEADIVNRTVQRVGGKYVAHAEPVGAAPPRNRLFQEAAGDWVLCVDSHVWLFPGVLERLVKFCDGNTSGDLFQGVLASSKVYKDDGTIDPVWTHCTATMGEDGLVGKAQVNKEALDPEAPPFEVPSSGIGLFLARRDQWLGFSEKFEGFGIEGYIQAKYRQHGRKAWCLPWLRWWHWFRDSKSQPVSYDMSWRKRTANMLHSHHEVGVPTLTEIRRHHVKTGRTSEADYQQLLKQLGIDEMATIARENRPAVTAPPAIAAEALAVDAPLNETEQKYLEQMPCPHRGRRSGTVLCNKGCPSMKSTPWATFDCQQHGLVVLSNVRKDLRSCMACKSAETIQALRDQPTPPPVGPRPSAYQPWDWEQKFPDPAANR